MTLLLDKNEEQIAMLILTGNGIKTNRGLMIGDDESKIIEKYGGEQKHKGARNVYTYTLKENPEDINPSYYIWIITKDEKVIEIQLYGIPK